MEERYKSLRKRWALQGVSPEKIEEMIIKKVEAYDKECKDNQKEIKEESKKEWKW